MPGLNSSTSRRILISGRSGGGDVVDDDIDHLDVFFGGWWRMGGLWR